MRSVLGSFISKSARRRPNLDSMRQSLPFVEILPPNFAYFSDCSEKSLKKVTETAYPIHSVGKSRRMTPVIQHILVG